MELMNQSVVIAGSIILAIVLFALLSVQKHKANSYSTGIKAANTSRIRQSAIYQKLEKRYKILRCILVACLVGSIVSSLFLIARPYETKEIESTIKKRDIIICLDVSYSLYDLNYEVTDYLEELVRGLQGDRIGINIFNTSTVTYVPLTDDYDYVIDKLDELEEYFVLQKEFMEKFSGKRYSDLTDEEYEEYEEMAIKLTYFDAGTVYNSDSKGSSLIGEGLATALYSFPYLGESERTRVIIMCTDNELSNIAPQVVDVEKAAEACAVNDVTVYGIYPREEVFYMPELYDYEECKSEFENAIKVTGGKLYIRTTDNSVKDIVGSIQKEDALLVKTVASKEYTDMPFIPFVTLLMCLVASITAGLVLQK